MADKTVFDVDMKVRFRKWYDFGLKNRVVLDQEDYEWLKEQASHVPSLKNQVDRLNEENIKMSDQWDQEVKKRQQVQIQLNKQKGRNRLLFGIIKDNGLYNEFEERVEEIRARQRKRRDLESDDLNYLNMI